MSHSSFRVAIVGYGIVGPLHALAHKCLPLLYPSLPKNEIAVVVESDSGARSKAHAQLAVPVTDSLEDAVEQHGVNLIDCCAPTQHHFSVGSFAINNGLPILCEKPLTGSELDSRRIYSLVDASSNCFGVNFNFRFIPALIEARRRVLEGAIGQLRSFRIEYFRSSNINRWKSGLWIDRSPDRGALKDLGPHAIDIAHYLFGESLSVSAHFLHYLPSTPRDTPEDIALLQVVMENGAIGTIEVSKVTPGATNDLNLFAYGTEGSLRFRMDDCNALEICGCGTAYPQWERLLVHNRAADPKQEVIPAETPTAVLHWHSASIASFLEAAAEGRTPPASVLDGLRVDLFIAAAQQSAVNRSIPETLKPLKP